MGRDPVYILTSEVDNLCKYIRHSNAHVMGFHSQSSFLPFLSLATPQHMPYTHTTAVYWLPEYVQFNHTNICILRVSYLPSAKPIKDRGFPIVLFLFFFLFLLGIKRSSSFHFDSPLSLIKNVTQGNCHFCSLFAGYGRNLCQNLPPVWWNSLVRRYLLRDWFSLQGPKLLLSPVCGWPTRSFIY